MDAAALPDAVDFVGPTEGTIFVRQAQLRYTKGPWSFSVGESADHHHARTSTAARASTAGTT